jgi:hypothetical protein
MTTTEKNPRGIPKALFVVNKQERKKTLTNTDLIDGRKMLVNS